jgi:hypothetical protein
MKCDTEVKDGGRLELDVPLVIESTDGASDDLLSVSQSSLEIWDSP